MEGGVRKLSLGTTGEWAERGENVGRESVRSCCGLNGALNSQCDSICRWGLWEEIRS